MTPQTIVFALSGVLLVSFVAGLAMLWCARAVYVRHGKHGRRTALMRIFGYLLLVFSFFCLALSVGNVWDIFPRSGSGQLDVAAILKRALPAAFGLGCYAAIPLLAARNEAHVNRVRQLLWFLEQAVRVGLPCSMALRALSREWSGRLSRRVARVAELVDLGCPLPEAIRIRFGRTTLEGDLALGVGWKMGTLENCLRRLHKPSQRAIDPFVSVILRQIAYTWILIHVLFFLAYRIIPIIPTMLSEYGRATGEPSVRSGMLFLNIYLSFSETVFGNAWLITLIYLFGLVFFILLILYHAGWLPTSFGRLSWFGHRLDSARILEQFSVCLGAGKDLGSAAQVLAEVYPKHYWRKRLARVQRLLASGVPWWSALVEGRVVGREHAWWLRSLEPLNAVAWGMAELAQRLRHQENIRLARWCHVTIFITVLVSAAVVGLTGAVLMESLTKLAQLADRPL